MGTDIHTIAQVKKDEKWETVAHNIGDEWRSYHSYAVLAGVRNGLSLAGMKIFKWQPISLPRGLPEDLDLVDQEVSIEPYFDGYETRKTKWLGDHSHSWLTLSELSTHLEKIKDGKRRVVGILTKEHYLETLALGKEPESWCSGVGGPNVTIVHETDNIENCTHVRCAWTRKNEDLLEYLFICVKELSEIAQKYGVDDVRFVFGFDS